ncbi:hypothetical protein [Paenibacillus jiagnxiensis]|uniref:hypothetical protein n=1 Tax=Paenibacillus jiagnxiensis TaxID=3228926 RepID=UPI00339F6182
MQFGLQDDGYIYGRLFVGRKVLDTDSMEYGVTEVEVWNGSEFMPTKIENLSADMNGGMARVKDGSYGWVDNSSIDHA